MRRIIVFILISLDFLLILFAYHSYIYSDKKFHLIFCNVGQGDGIFLRTPKGYDIVIDGGPTENGMTQCLERHMPFWDRNLDAVFLTHPDSDHLTGLIGVVRSYNVKFFGTAKAPKETDVYKELMSILKKKNLKVEWVFRGDTMRTKDGVSLKVQWPTLEFLNNPSDDTNDYSLVHLVEYGDFRVLLTGDVPSVYLNSILPTVSKINIFKPPHHGSKTGVDEFTFQHVVPEFAVISAGKKNRYGHPNKEVVKLLESKKIPYTTTFEGDVEVVIDGKEWRVE